MSGNDENKPYLASLGTEAVHDVKDTLGQSYARADLRECIGCQWRELAGLDYDSATTAEGRSSLEGEEIKREVPRRDDAADAGSIAVRVVECSSVGRIVHICGDVSTSHMAICGFMANSASVEAEVLDCAGNVEGAS